MSIEYKDSISAADYNRLRTGVGWSEVEANQTQAGIDHAAFLICACDGGSAVGMARLITDGGYAALIADVIVLPGYQGKGIGKHMVAAIMEHIRSSLRPGQSVLINLMAAKGRETFYKQFGFVERPNEDLGCGMTQWVIKE